MAVVAVGLFDLHKYEQLKAHCSHDISLVPEFTRKLTEPHFKKTKDVYRPKVMASDKELVRISLQKQGILKKMGLHSCVSYRKNLRAHSKRGLQNYSVGWQRRKMSRRSDDVKTMKS